MAEDVVVLLDYLGWIRHRELHIVGISMGGVISQGEHVYACSRWDIYDYPRACPQNSHRIASQLGGNESWCAVQGNEPDSGVLRDGQ